MIEQPPVRRTGDWSWRPLPGGAAEITRYEGKEDVPEVPAALEGCAVVRIGEGAFDSCSCLREVSLPEGITGIGDRAFARCLFLREIRLPGTLLRLGDRAFAACKGLARIALPDSLREIGLNPFLDCVSLAGIAVSPAHHVLRVEGPLLLHRAEGRLICCAPAQETTELAVPPGIRTIDYGAFRGCWRLERLRLPDSVTEICGGAFDCCLHLAEINLPPALTSLGDCAFWGCGRLSELTVPASVTRLGEAPFPDNEDFFVTVHRGSPAEAWCRQDPFFFMFHTDVVD